MVGDAILCALSFFRHRETEWQGAFLDIFCFKRVRCRVIKALPLIVIQFSMLLCGLGVEDLDALSSTIVMSATINCRLLIRLLHCSLRSYCQLYIYLTGKYSCFKMI